MIPNVITFTIKKKKIRLLLLGAFLSLIFGGLELYLFHLLKFGSGKLIMLCLAVVSCFYIIICIRGLIQFRKEHYVGIYISSEGVNDISTGNNIGTILWKDVKEIKIMSELGAPQRKYVVLKVHNPTEYIQREISLSKRRTLELKLQYYGSPICFSNRALNCTFDQLKDAVFLKYNQYKESISAETEV